MCNSIHLPRPPQKQDPDRATNVLQRMDVARGTYTDHLFGNVKGSSTTNKHCPTSLTDKVVILIKIQLLGKKQSERDSRINSIGTSVFRGQIFQENCSATKSLCYTN